MSTEITEASTAAVESVTTLSEPTPELAARLLADVAYEQQIVGLKMSAMGGSSPSTLLSLPQVAHFIQIGTYEEALNDRQATVGYVDPGALAAWISQVLGDDELAEAVRAEIGKGEFYGNIAMAIKALLHARVAQCLAVLAPPEGTPTGEGPAS